MKDTQQQAAMDALKGLDTGQVHQVLGWLTSSHPDAVLAAVDGLRRHERVVAGLLQREPPLF